MSAPLKRPPVRASFGAAVIVLAMLNGTAAAVVGEAPIPWDHLVAVYGVVVTIVLGDTARPSGREWSKTQPSAADVSGG